MLRVDEISEAVVRIRDTCNVYALRRGREAVAVDFGSGAVLDVLDRLGVDRITDVLITHHHRDQTQGLARAAEHGARIWVPEGEQELIADGARRLLRRSVACDYDLREDRFSPLGRVPVAGTVSEYRNAEYGEVTIYSLPTPGHTPGSFTYMHDDRGRQLAFCGDLLYGDGQLWSVAATQWTYTGPEGLYASYLSCGQLAVRKPDLLLPSHGDPVEDPPAALTLARRRLRELGDMRAEQPYDLDAWEREPWVAVTPHLLRNRTSVATSYALLSDSGQALLLDWGYDQATGVDMPTERAARRPLLSSLRALRRNHLVERVDVVIPTHYHDDHVAGLNLLRRAEATKVWAAEHVAPVLEQPERYDLPCLWFDPIRVDRRLPLGEPIPWQEYELTLHPLPGHTLYACAIQVEVDGRLVLVVGDQYSHLPGGRAILNYQYRNRFRLDDYAASAELYRTLRPDLILTGHSGVVEPTEELYDELAAEGRRVAELHRELLPLGEVDLGPGGVGARIEPYRSRPGELELEVTVRNPFPRAEEARVALVVPDGWSAEPAERTVELAAHAEAALEFRVAAAGEGVLAADVTVGDVRFGQQAEALVVAE